MTLERHRAIEDLFDQLVDEPPDDQQRRLGELCGGDLELRAEVLRLLDGDARGHALLRLDAAHLAGELLDAAAPWVPDRVGNYIIQKYLGEGGMGSVYLATREDLGSQVALKFLRDHWASPAGRRRFAREQRTLAALTHRNIARLYEAGVTGGQPWFAMEYVDGAPILEYCRRRQLDVMDRVKLFRAVCEAVHYAHRKLVVHLDLKPSNVFVNEDGEVKLLDFGIARHLLEEGSAAATTSVCGLLSLNYAAPEQILGKSLDVQADVYALGVVLYELLVGAPPADLSGLPAVDLARALEEEPTPPSVASREGHDARVQASRAQWKDLDVLCSTALSRDKEERYESVGVLMADIDHFIKDEPLDVPIRHVRYYRARKFARRHRGSIVIATSVAAAIAAVVVFYNVRLVSARDRAVMSEAKVQRVYRLMLNLFEGDDAAAGPSEELRVVSLLERGVGEVESLAQEPEMQVELKYTLGGLYHKLGHVDRAEPLLASAVATSRSLLGPNDARAIRPQIALGLLRLDQGRSAEARRLVDEALTLAKRRYATDSVEVATVVAARGKVLVAEGQYDEAIALLDQAVSILSRAPPAAELSEALGDLANAHYQLGHIDASGVVNRRGLALDRQLFGDRHPSVSVDLYNLGTIALDRAVYAEGERLFREGLIINERWYGTTHPKTAATALMLGRSVAYLGRVDEASSLYQRALDGFQRAYGEHHVRVGSVLSLMGDLARDQGDLKKAEDLFVRAAAIFKEVAGERHEFYLHQLSNLGSVHLARQQYERAIRFIRPALEQLSIVVPEQRYTGLAHIRLGTALAGLGDHQGAERHAQAGHAILLAATSPDSEEVRRARQVLADIADMGGVTATTGLSGVEAVR